MNMQKKTVLVKKFKLSDGNLSAEEKKVLAKLGKAAKLVAPIYEKQINDLYPGANFYPHDMPTAEIIREAQANPEIFNPYTVVEKEKGGALQVIPYHVKYAFLIKPVVKLIREAAYLTTNLEFSKRLEVQANALESGSYEAANIYWLSMKPYKIDIVIGPVERYEDRLFFKKTCYSAVVGIIDEKSTAEAEEIRDALLSSERKSFSLSQKVNFANRIQVRVDRIAVMAGLDARARFAGAFLPDDTCLIEKYGGEVIIFGTAVEQNFKDYHYPTFKKVFEPSFQRSYSQETLLDASRKLLLIREISSALVKYHDAEARLGEYYPIINEMAAYVLAVKNAGSLLLKDVISQKELEAIIIMFLCRAFNSFHEAEKVKSLTHYSRGYAIAINYFLKNGSLREYQGISWVNFTKMFVALTELASIMDRILAFGDITDVQRLVNEYGNTTDLNRLLPKI